MTLFRPVSSWASRVFASASMALAPAAKSGPQAPLLKIVTGSARDRWQSPSVQQYTPQRVEQVLRGAFSGDLTAQWELFDLMEQTWPRLGKNLNELKSVLEECEWSLQAWAPDGEQPDEEAIRRKKVVEEILWHFEPDPTLDENDFGDLTRDLADAWGKGISIQELDWEPRGYEGGTIVGLKASRWLHPRYYGYPTQSNAPDRLMLRSSEVARDNTATRTVPGAADWIPFPKDKFLIGVAKQKTGHPIGAALLRPLAWWWAVGNFTSEWLVNLAQIFGVPIRWASYAQGTSPEQISKIEEMLANMGSASWGAFPAGTTLELKEAMKAGSDNPQLALLSLIDRICDLLILGQTLTSDVSGSGSRALGDVHADVLSGRKGALLSWVIKVLNQQLIPSICRLNFGDTASLPYFVAGEEDEKDAKSAADTFKVVLDSGVPIPRQFYYDTLGIPAPAEGDDVIEPKAAPAPVPPPGFGSNPAEPMPADRVPAQARATAGLVTQASSADDRLAEAVAESVTGVQATWLRGALPWFRRLVVAAKDPNVTDGDFTALLIRAQRNLPDDLAPLLNTEALAKAMEANMGAAMVNGAVQGWLKRQPKGAA